MPTEHKIHIIIGVWGLRRCLMKTPIPTNNLPPENFIVEIDGKFESAYGTLTGALKAGLELRHPQSQVKVRDANEQTPADEQSEQKMETGFV